MKEFLTGLKGDKIKINWNKNPIKMDLFLSFLTVETERATGHLGHSNGWTKLLGDNDLEINGGIVGRVEYLDSLKYGERLDNPYNNFINPFYLFDIFTNEGKVYFLDYYKEEIDSLLINIDKELEQAKGRVKALINNKNTTRKFWLDLTKE